MIPATVYELPNSHLEHPEALGCWSSDLIFVMLDPARRRVAMAILDAYTRKLTEKEMADVLAEAKDKEATRRVCERQASDIPGVDAELDRILREFIPSDTAKDLMRALWLLSTSAGTFLLSGHWCPFDQLTMAQREAVLLSWGTSMIGDKRKLAKAFRGLASMLFAAYVPKGKTQNPNLADIGFAVEKNSVEGSGKDVLKSCELKLGAGTSPIKFEADVVIVGSGVGGSMAAAELCEAGYKVLMLEKGEFVVDAKNSMREKEMFERLYERGPYLCSEDGSMTILAGSTVGGGGTVNWFCSLKTPHYVREEWASKYGLTQFISPWFTRCVDVACEKLAVQTDKVVHTKQNRVLLEGCERLGYHCETAPQQGDPTGDEGLCCVGVKNGRRQGTMNSLLLDAATTGRFSFLPRCFVDRVRIDSATRTANGVLARCCGRAVEVSARIVVASGGSLNTPLLLKRTGLRNRHIGQNLRLHPVVGLFGVMKDSARCYVGAPMTSVSNVVANLDGKGYGVRLETPSAHPGLLSGAMPYWGGNKNKRLINKLNNTAMIICLTRDTGSGSVWGDEKNRPRVNYCLNAKDKAHMLQAMEKACNVLVAAGAVELGTTHNGIEPYRVRGNLGIADPRYKAWIRRVYRAGLKANDAALFSAHQMGTCKMGVSPSAGVVDPKGEAWEAKNLFVCDGSVFPTPSGTNPMITIAAISYGTAQNIKAALAKASSGAGRGIRASL